MMKVFNKKGFTLFEIMVVASMLGLIAMAIGTTFNSGMNVYQRVQNYEDVNLDIILALERMEKDVRNTFFLKNVPFVGTLNSLAMPSVFYNYDEKGNELLSVGRSHYFYDNAAEAFVYSTQSYGSASLGGETTIGDSEVLSKVEDVEFGYLFYDRENALFDWRDSWDEESTMPKGIKISLFYKDGDETKKIERKIMIPFSQGIDEEKEEEGDLAESDVL